MSLKKYLSTKYYIHCCYWLNKSPNIAFLKWRFEQHEYIEILNVIKLDKLYNEKWEKFINMYDDMNV